MRTRPNQLGFSAFEFVLVLLVIGVIGFVGYSVHNRLGTKAVSDSGTTPAASSQPTTASDVASAPTVSSTSDLDKAAATLDQTDPSGSNTSDASQLDSQTSSF